MSIQIVLTRKVPLRRFDLVATIAREEPRAELAPVLVWAKQEVEANRPLDPRSLAQHLLGSGAGMITVAKRLLLICRDLYLVTDNFEGLTEQGVSAAATGKVLQPDKGEWSLWTADDPLLQFPIIGVKPRSGTQNGVEHRRRDEPRTRAEELPDWVGAASGQVAPMLMDGHLARFDDIAAAAIEINTTDELELRWTLSEKPGLRIVGSINGRHRIDQPVKREDLPSLDRVWYELLASKRLHRSWDDTRQALMIPFAAASNEDERLNMRTTLEFASPHVDGAGSFRDVKVPNLRLCPASDGDAIEWARHQIISRISGIQTARVFESLTQRVRSAFAGWDVEIPSRHELARQLATDAQNGTRTQGYWAVQAALDWNL